MEYDSFYKEADRFRTKRPTSSGEKGKVRSALNSYIADLSHPLLTPEREKELGEIIQTTEVRLRPLEKRLETVNSLRAERSQPTVTEKKQLENLTMAIAHSKQNSIPSKNLESELVELQKAIQARENPTPEEIEEIAQLKRDILQLTHGADYKKALHELIEANLRFVVHVAKRIKPPGLSFPDRIQEGNLALHKAARHFDPQKERRFATFAGHIIVRDLYTAAVKQGTDVQISHQLMGLIYKYDKIRYTLSQRFCREPTIEEIEYEMEVRNLLKKRAQENLIESLGRKPLPRETQKAYKELLTAHNNHPLDTQLPDSFSVSNTTKKHVERARQFKMHTRSLDDSVGDDEDGRTLHEYTTYPGETSGGGAYVHPAQIELRLDIAKALATTNLTAQERVIVEDVLIGGHTQIEMRSRLSRSADHFSYAYSKEKLLTPQRVQQIHKSACTKLKAALEK